jgi:hypothetical protein
MPTIREIAAAIATSVGFELIAVAMLGLLVVGSARWVS